LPERAQDGRKAMIEYEAKEAQARNEPLPEKPVERRPTRRQK
jgi:hypothetical protein